MEYILDMVHYNPREKPFETKFFNPEVLAQYGYTGQVFKHINSLATFAEFDDKIFPSTVAQSEWLNEMSKKIIQQNLKARQAKLDVYYHIDLFVLPESLIKKYSTDLCDPKTGSISIDKPATLELHRIMFDELFAHYDFNGLIVRVGETYLFDTPFHCGNKAIEYHFPKGDEIEKIQFVKLLNFLRETVCVRHNKKIIFRTWDCYEDRFHANIEYYLDITNQIEPHENLIFSIKHTLLDFWRSVKFNPVLTSGKHNQIVEVQCQREYEGKGAFPNYVMHGVINGFQENTKIMGLKDIYQHPLIKGIYTWSRGGGWYGPYIKNEFWPELNTYVVSKWASSPEKNEEEIFYEFCEQKLGLNAEDSCKFRKMALLSQDAILKGIYCRVYDISMKESSCPANLWTRDDRLGGLERLEPVFQYLWLYNYFDTAIEEKAEAVDIWKRMINIFLEIDFPDRRLGDAIHTSLLYGFHLFKLMLHGWKVMSIGYIAGKEDCLDENLLRKALAEYDAAKSEYDIVASLIDSASLYKGYYFNSPGELPEPGLDSSIEKCRKLLN